MSQSSATSIPQLKKLFEVAAGGNKDMLLKYLKEELLADVPLAAAEEEKLAQLAGELVRKKE